MTFTDKVRSAFRPLPRNSATEHHVTESSPNGAHANEKGTSGAIPIQYAHTVEVGVSAIDATQAVWGNKGLRLVILGLAMIMILFELDNSTVYVYNNYSTSSFSQLSTLGTLSTATTIIFAVVKPPIAKISNVIGRGYTLIFTISCYLLAYILMASASNIGPYAAGLVFYNVGQSGTNVMTNVILSDITSPRWRGLAIGLSYFPFLITPWVSAFIAESVVAENGIGWRWGIGMFAILMPFGASFIIGTLLYYSRKAKKLGVLETRKINFYEFCSEIDLGGICFFVGGFACLLLPLTVAAQLTDGWRTPWIIALLVVGVILLVCLPLYEKRMALYPLVPVSYFKNSTITLSCLLIALDSVGFSATHTYLYAWSTVSYNLDTRTATFLVYTNGVMQCLVGIFAGWYMFRTGRYKWMVMAGTCLRLIGYGIMLRLRTQDSTIGELFGQQLIQGTGSGIISTALLVAPTVVVPRAQIAQVLALVFCCSFLGSSIGATIAGAIYTNTMREELWKWLGDQGTAEMVNMLYNSITGVLPESGSADRIAIDNAYSQVITYITYAAIGASIPPVILGVFLPNFELPRDRADIIAGSHTYAPQDEHAPAEISEKKA
ncbi:putative Siderochrome-iron transporter [Seiridium unicorne]|uniref:Siderochrome-iron transporter n=1 Tax=Seiridium unicorne TaxID=138068 RepID=A0ABR2UF58_9PEZI